MDTNTDTIFYPSIISVKESLSPDEINYNINSLLEDKIKERIGNKCHKEGYIKKDSIKIVERTLGQIISSHFNGDIVYNIKVSIEICKPVQGDEIICSIVGKNPAGIVATKDILFIALSKLHHTDTNIFDTLHENDTIKIKVICSQYEYNDESIQIMGQFISKIN
jgi:hypothetical protein